jgi:RNA polymerase sigma factor (sigma-70 family)
VQESENILIEECIKWDPSAQGRLYKLYSSKMFAVCFRYAKSREEAEDILQEGFVKVFENIGKFRKEGSLEGWIRRIMYHTAIQKFREKKEVDNAISLDSTNLNLTQQSSEDILGNIQVKELLKLIQELPNRYRLVFNLYVFEGLKHREIAEQLGITEGTSKSNLSDARAILQKKIQNSLAGKIHL